MSSFKTNLKNLDWMSDETKVRAIEKANMIQYKIGYPDMIMNKKELKLYYDDYSVSDGHFANIYNHRKWSAGKDFQTYGKKPDRSEWGMYPAQVNAYYSPSFNQIVFPAGILQDPFFVLNFMNAVLYGGMGTVMGHEISHGFDDSGAHGRSSETAKAHRG
eukprot:TRINITY_DN1640_c0_g1_i1.p1 TRINITY_DN1640_c0_g1~~TRINITY_DN1640_c0_g1_i1.p1  ORF type:complete len:176 (+),score=43.65 TRINITY_DN1640_c0_g1_i1:51-530(+)